MGRDIGLGREVIMKLRFGSRSKKFKNRCSRPTIVAYLPSTYNRWSLHTHRFDVSYDSFANRKSIAKFVVVTSASRGVTTYAKLQHAPGGFSVRDFEKFVSSHITTADHTTRNAFANFYSKNQQ